MATPHQIEANRRNSQLSTGPRTPEGKSVSRFNALKSGITAKSQVIPGEDPAELEAIADGYHLDWAPATYLERFLVDSLVRADWLLQRLSRVEAQLWTVGPVTDVPTGAPLGETYTRALDPFSRLQRRIDSTERSYYRALTQLQRLKEVPATAGPSPMEAQSLMEGPSRIEDPSRPVPSANSGPTPRVTAVPPLDLASFGRAPAPQPWFCTRTGIEPPLPDRIHRRKPGPLGPFLP